MNISEMGPAERYSALKQVERSEGLALIQEEFDRHVAALKELALSLNTASAETEALKRAIVEAEAASPKRLCELSLSNLNSKFSRER